jgi:hypothetical protein
MPNDLQVGTAFKQAIEVRPLAEKMAALRRFHIHQADSPSATSL